MLPTFLLLALLPAAPPSLSDADLRNAVVTLQRSACYGDCPVYEVTVTGDGAVSYHGSEFVQVKGEHTARTSRDEFRKLVARFEQAGYFSIRKNYDYGGCSTRQLCRTGFLNDAPGAVLSLTLRGRTHEIHHAYGCTCAPEILFKLEAAVDKIAGTDRWVGKEKGGQWAGSWN